MVASYEAQSGFGLRLDLSASNIARPELDDFKQYIWDRSDKDSHNYYGDFETMFSEDNFDLYNFDEAFPAIRFAYCGNPYGEHRKEEYYFAVAKTTFVSVGVSEFQDLSLKSNVSSEAAAQLNMLSRIAFDDSPRWYTWFYLG